MLSRSFFDPFVDGNGIVYAIPLHNLMFCDDFPLLFQEVKEIIVPCATSIALADVDEALTLVCLETLVAIGLLRGGQQRSNVRSRCSARTSGLPCVVGC